MMGWLAALRIARREARRAKGRSALVLAMIALPVAAVAFGAVTFDTSRLTPGEQADRLMGTAQAAVMWPFDGPVNQHPTETRFVSDVFVPAPGSTPPEPSLDRLLALLPPGTTAVTDQAGTLPVRTASGVAALPARMLDYADPAARGVYRQLSGRAPESAGEVALTPAASRRLGAGVGGTVRLRDGSRTFSVTAIVEHAGDLRATTILLPTGSVPADTLSTDRRDRRYLVTTPGPMTWADVQRLNEHGVLAISRHVLAHPPARAQSRFLSESNYDEDAGAALGLALAAGVALLEIVLLAGPAFAVGARRRRRDLALVAAAGGTPAHIRRIVLADGVVLGALAAAVGVALGVAVAAALRALLEDLSGVRFGAFRVFPAALAILAGLALVTGVLAALVPAWISSRQDVVSALAGRRGITRSRRRWVVAGGVLAALGAAVAGLGAWRIDWATILIGLVVVELGLVLCTPAAVGLVARLGRMLPVAPRVALRDASRNRTAAAPAISAVMAAVIGTLAIGVIVLASNGRDAAEHRALSRPGDVAVFVATAGPKGGGPVNRDDFPSKPAEVLRTTLPVEQLYEISQPGCETECLVQVRMPEALACPYNRSDLSAAQQRAARRDPRCAGAGTRSTYFGAMGTTIGTGMVFVVAPEAAGAVLHFAAANAARTAAALRSGAVVVSDPRTLEGGRVTLALRGVDAQTKQAGRTVTAPGVALPQPTPVPVAFMTAQTARSLGLTVSPMILYATTSHMPTIEEYDRASAALGQGYELAVEWERSSGAPSLLVLAIISGFVTLVAAAVATGLAAADGRADLGTLAAVGASPRLRRVLSLSQAGVIAGLGSLVGAAAGVGSAIAVLVALNQRQAAIWPAPASYPLAVPWLNVAIAVVAVPLVAMLGAGLLTRSRLPIERRL